MVGKSQGSSHPGQSKGSQQSAGHVKNEPQRAPEAGKKGVEHAHGGTREQHAKAGEQTHKSK